MVKLLDCPPEILLEIAKAVPGSSRQDLACSSRYLYRLIQPLVEYSLVIETERDLHVCLLKAIKNPWMGSKVHSLELRHFVWSLKGAERFVSQGEREENLIYFAEAAKDERLNKFDNAILAGCVEACVALLLHFCPNIESLQTAGLMYHDYCQSKFDYLDAFIFPDNEGNCSMWAGLRNLRELRVPFYETKLHVGLEEFIAFFLLPRIEKLSLHLDQAEDTDTWADSWADGMNNSIDHYFGKSCVTELELIFSNVGRPCDTMLRLSNGLKKLVCDFRNAELSYEHFDSLDFATALLHTKDTLEELDIRFGLYEPGSDILLGSLRNFPVLQRLTVDLRTFPDLIPYGDVLPESLRVLDISYSGHSSGGSLLLVEMVRTKRKLLPKLETLKISIGKEPCPALFQLQKACREEDVKLINAGESNGNCIARKAYI